LVLAAFGLVLFTQAGADSLALIVIGNVLMSLGFGMTFTLTADMVVGSAPPERAGAASAISETGAEFGGALGIAVLGSLGMAIYRNGVAVGLPSGIPAEAAVAAQETLGGALAVASELPDQLGAALLGVANGAFIQGLHLIALIGVVAFTGAAIVSAIRLRHIQPHAEHGEAEAAEPLPELVSDDELEPVP
jgi:DHA2 family multidrug resistance protein-like MFS transporter